MQPFKTEGEKEAPILFHFDFPESHEQRNAGFFTCAWSWRDACGRPCWPWPQRHAWREFGRTRSVHVLVLDVTVTGEVGMV